MAGASGSRRGRCRGCGCRSSDFEGRVAAGRAGGGRGCSGTARVIPPCDIAAAVQLACLLEVSAPKPGNVSPGRHFADTRYEDFLASAAAIGAPFAGAGTRPLGATIRLAVEATSRWCRSNTNLGIVLLLAPLARAAASGSDPGDARDWGQAPESAASGSDPGDARHWGQTPEFGASWVPTAADSGLP